MGFENAVKQYPSGTNLSAGSTLPPSLATTISAQDGINSRLEDTLKQAANLATILRGPIPVGAEKASDLSLPGAIDALDGKQRRSFDLISAINDELGRIATALGA